MNSGKEAAYRQLTPPNSDLSGVINQQEYFNNQHEKNKERKADKRNSENLKNLEDLSKINPGKKTGYTSIDQAVTDAYMRKGGLVEQYANAKKRLLDSGNTDNEAYGIIKNIERFTQELGQMKQMFSKYGTALSEGIASGKISKSLNSGFISNMQKIAKGGISINTDDLANISIDNIGGLDLDGDKLPDKLSLDTFMDKNNFGIWQPDFDLNNFNSQLGKKYKTFKEETINPDGNNPYKTIVKQGLNPDNILLVRDDYKQRLGADVKNLTIAGKSFLYQQGENPKTITQEKYNSLIKNLVTDFEKISAKEKSEKINHTAKNSAGRLNLARTKENRIASEETTNTNINPMTENGKPLERNLNGEKYKGYTVGRKMKSGDVDTKVTILRGEDEVEIKEYYISENGEIAYSGRKKMTPIITTGTGSRAKTKKGKPEWKKNDGVFDQRWL